MATDYVSEAQRAYDELAPAWEGRTVTLLSSPHAHTYAAIFSAVFPDMTEAVPDTVLYDAMDQVMEGLAATGAEADWPMSRGGRLPGREAARRLMDDWGWIERVRSRERPGHYDFRLTLDGMRAMGAIRDLARRDASANGAVMDMLLDRLNDLYTQVSGDPVRQRAVLEEEARRATERLEAFDAAGGVAELGHEEALDRLRAVLSVMDPIVEGEALMARRLQDQVDAMVADLRREGSVAGEVIEGYYERSRELQYQTKDGRDYRAVVEAMSAGDGVVRMDDLVDGIMASEAFGHDPGVRRRIEGRWRQVTDGARGIGRILDSASGRITAATAMTTAATRRTLADALRRAEGALGAMPAGATVPVPHVARCRMVAPTRATPMLGRTSSPPPAPLEEGGAQPARRSRALARRGGPHRERVARHMLERAVRRPDGRIDAAATFARLPVEDRRLVEAMSVGRAARGGARATWQAVSATGAERAWVGPAAAIDEADLERMAHGGR